MDRVQFDRRYDTDRRVINFVALLQFGALLTNGIILLAGASSLRGLALAVALGALLAAALLALFLYLRFRTTSAARDKYQLQKQLQRAKAQIAAAEARVGQAVRMRDSISASEQSALAARQESHDRAVAGIQAHQASIQANRDAEVDAALKRLQDSYVRSGLANQSIKNAKISGIGPKLKDRLASYGIVFASDVSHGQIDVVPGFGEAKISSLMAWRRGVEADLNASKPINIPADDEARIREKYAPQLVRLDDDEQAAHESLAADLATISRQAAESHVANDAAETNARGQAASLQVTADELESDLDPYSDITLMRYVLECVKSNDGASRARLVTVLVPIVLVLGLVGQSLAAAGTLTSFAGEAISKALSRSEPTEIAQAVEEDTSGDSLEQPTQQSVAVMTATLNPSATRTATAIPTHRPTSTISATATRSATATTTTVANARSKDTETGIVVRVIDGDTIDVEIDGIDYRVRYIGIDTPESNETCGTDATQANVALVFGKTVTLEKDISETDRYDRLLRYVYVGDDMVNAELVRLGFAESARYPPDTKYAGVFDTLEAGARTSWIGCWPSGAFGGTGGGGEAFTPTSVPLPTNTILPTTAASPVPLTTSTPEPLPTATAAQVPAEQSSCHPSYPGACLLIGAGDYDCAGGSGNGPNYVSGPISVLPPDPFRLDSDGDGIGCEG